MQTRDKLHQVTLPRIRSSPLCPHAALRRAIRIYNPHSSDPLFQIRKNTSFQVLTESRIRKVLSRANSELGYSSNHFTFHTFRRSGASLAYNSHVPIQKIQSHGSWSSDSVWTYIQQGKQYSRDVASSLATVVHNADI